LPKAFLHDEVFMNLITNDTLSMGIALVVSMHGENFEPVDYLVALTSYVFHMDYSGRFDDDRLDFFGDHAFL
jgi:hypothetical protein